MATQKILFVDDEAQLLEGLRRNLRKRYEFDTAGGGAEALGMIQESGPYAMIVSDMRMPEMSGVELLAQVKKLAPDTVRVMLTGNADQQTAIDAVNEGDVFRFLNKPCEPDVLSAALDAGLEQHRLRTMEKELLASTLRSSVKVITEVLALVNPEAFGRTGRLKKRLRELAVQMGLERRLWEYEVLAMLSQIGCVILPEDVLRKHADGEDLSAEESQLLDMHPCVGGDLVAKIPRLEDVAAAIQYQGKNFDGSGIPTDEISGNAIPLGARMLHAILDLDQAENLGLSPQQALERLKQKPERYDPKVLDALAAMQQQPVSAAAGEREVPVAELTDGMVLAEDIKDVRGMTVICKGMEINAPTRAILANFIRIEKIIGTVKVAA